MGLITEIQNGQVVSTNKDTTKVKDSNDAYDKDMFLKLLVAEMEYQDPLEPTSNSEYVAELASFTQIETVQGVGAQMDQISANNLIGNYVIVKDTSTVGVSKEIEGKVDYTTQTDDGVMLSINGSLYKLSDVETVINEDYYLGTTAAATISAKIKELPKVEELDGSHLKDVEEMVELYNSLSATQQDYVNPNDVKYLENAYKALVKKAEDNMAAAEEAAKQEAAKEESNKGADETV